MIVQAFHQFGVIGILAVFIGLMVRLLKADKLNEILAKYKIPAIPKSALPWLALALGIALTVLNAKLGGANWVDSALAGVDGILASALAVLGQETLPSVSPKSVASFVFGKKKD